MSNVTKPRRRKPSRPSRHVFLLLGTYYRANHEGIARYAKERHWTLDVSYMRAGELPVTMRMDGVIGLITHPRDLATLKRLPKVPLVDLSAAWGTAALPDRGGTKVARVLYDNAGMGRAAAEHFIGHGLRHIALFNQGNFWMEQERRMTFRAVIKKAGRTFHELAHYQWVAEDRGTEPATVEDRILPKLKAALQGLPKPVGVFTPADDAALLVVQACEEAGLRVPDDVAVLGCHNEALICDFAPVQLSSVDEDLERQGYEAARLLDRLMDGEPLPPAPVIVPVKCVATRASTDILAIDRVEVKAALRYIQEHYREPLTAATVARAAGVSRRTLSWSFKKHLGRSVSAEIARLRINRAKELLAQTHLKTWQVAEQAGFSGMEHLSRAFTRIVGEYPRDYRQHHPKQAPPR